ncbi:glycosyltransferase family 2 protein [Terribacillus saccharophilus]|uniref:Glycosyltransferase n=1 Tax=Terribacillus saccharophilus TaxID=361277 RepID=A0A268A869_9BACI|nr:glycosyltransferase family 2 protein [Terribacillus saccharophilus]PAD20325.1 glycosyltransferase [Terribacillus saccharophilus]PAF18235.1 glycosyltransferase [Terribacillus saccharophilus]PAF20735.1 glycosyltransferase [Terribacillus saccharophilus]PAF35872.1 glycosyltransferase [Terribacillus saccharophilus]PAF39992.1 glycosyltransferase [Terribacillus saccharophilus]
MAGKLLSVIVPSFNEAENVKLFYEELAKELQYSPYDYEVIYVDDGSSDTTLLELKELADMHYNVQYVSFTRNFGKEAAILAGFQHAKGDCAVVIDADLQHPVALLHELLAGFEEGYDQVIARRNRKGESLPRKVLSTMYYKIINRFIDVRIQNGVGDFRLLSRRAIDALLILSEGNRFSKGLFSWIGFEQKTVYYDNVSRQNGESKWSFGNLINYGIEGIVSFNTRPLRVCLYAGFIVLFLSLAYILYTFVEVLVRGVITPGYFTLITAILFLGGVQLVSLGVIGEYIGRIYNETKRRPHYLVKDTNIEAKKHYEKNMEA